MQTKNIGKTLTTSATGTATTTHGTAAKHHTTKRGNANRAEPSPRVQQIWAARASIWKQSPTSTVQAQRRWLFLLDLPREDRYEAFLQATAEVSQATKASYWASYLSLLKILDVPTTSAEKQAAKRLEQAAHSAPPTAPVPPLQEAQLERLLARDASHLATMIGLAFRGGQRMADVIQLKKEDILLLPHRALITFRRGKVVPRIGPFTISLPTNLGHGKCAVVARVQEMLKTTAPGFILTHGNTEVERAQVSSEVTRRLKAIDPNLEARSIRRGGLSRLAAAGASETALLLYSRHASTSMLYRYLNAGQLMVAHHAIQDAAQTQAEEHLSLQMDTITSAMGASTTTH